MDNLILLGAGGHCKVVADIVKGQYNILGVTDIDSTKHGSFFYGMKVLGGDEILPEILKMGTVNAIVTVGSIGNPKARIRLYNYAVGLGFNMISSISRHAIVSDTVMMGKGNVVMEGVIIHGDTVIGNNTILNTACIIEHDCAIGDHVHISPGARVAGGVTIGEGSHIGLGANIIQGINIGKNCIIGSGATVIRDIPDNSVCVGVPARIIKQI